MVEIEAKFRVEEDCFDALCALEAVGPLRVAGRREADLSDLYHDTPDRQVAASGSSLRIRRVNGEPLFTVKTGGRQAALSRREEIEEPAEGDLGEWVARQKTAGRLPENFPSQALAPVLEIRNRRTMLDLEGSEGTQVEMALDRVRFLGSQGEREHQELELELKSGSEDLLREACAWLEERFSIAPCDRSKYSRALEEVG